MALFQVSTAMNAPGIARYAICGVTDHTSPPLGSGTRPVASAITVATATEIQPSDAVRAV